MSDVNCSPYQQGLAAMRKVYAGEIIELPEGTLPFNDVMLRTLFAEVWTETCYRCVTVGCSYWA